MNVIVQFTTLIQGVDLAESIRALLMDLCYLAVVLSRRNAQSHVNATVGIIAARVAEAIPTPTLPSLSLMD